MMRLPERPNVRLATNQNDQTSNYPLGGGGKAGADTDALDYLSVTLTRRSKYTEWQFSAVMREVGET